jgi:hypothetical protein
MMLLNNYTNIQMLNIKTPFFFPTYTFIFIRIFSPFLFLYQIPSSHSILSSGIWLAFLACLCFGSFAFFYFGYSLVSGLSLFRYLGSFIITLASDINMKCVRFPGVCDFFWVHLSAISPAIVLFVPYCLWVQYTIIL